MAYNHHPSYSDNPLWSDITPIPLDEGPGPGPALASIAYSPRYSTAMSYLRAVMASNEYSERALSLTEDIISMNPAHYTVWLYRAKTIREMGKDVLEELAWLDGVSRKSLKNYQIWHHRQTLMSTLPSPPATEPQFLTKILSLDSKNYHVWTYRQWLVSHFDLFDSPTELDAIETLLREDVRNNSAWNHRWFLCFGKDELKYGRGGKGGGGGGVVVDEDLIDREVAFAQEKILLAPQNQSPWNYLRGLYRKAGRPLAELRSFAEQFAATQDGGDDDQDDDDNDEENQEAQMEREREREQVLDLEEGVRSSHALDLLADIYAAVGETERARKVLEVLGRRWDPVRKGYWDYKAGLLLDDEDGEKEKERGIKAVPDGGQGVAVA